MFSLQGPPKAEVPLALCLCHLGGPRVRDHSLCTERLTEVIVSGMEVYIHHSFSRPKSSKPWFNTACSRAVRGREAAPQKVLKPSIT